MKIRLTYADVLSSVDFKETEIAGAAFVINQPVVITYSYNVKKLKPTFEYCMIPVKTICLANITDGPSLPMEEWLHGIFWNVPLLRQLNKLREYAESEINDFGRDG